ncbi:MAG: hypothetical protein ACRDP6_29760 [Actinoallomurus sp.]
MQHDVERAGQSLDVDAYNDTVERANSNVNQVNGALAALEAQVNAITTPTPDTTA